MLVHIPEINFDEMKMVGARGGRGWQHISIKYEFVKQYLDFDIPGRSWRIGLKEITS